jgi:hypothetical protein
VLLGVLFFWEYVECIGAQVLDRWIACGQFAVHPLVQAFEQAGAAEDVRPRPRDIQFRGEYGRSHELIIKTSVLRCQRKYSVKNALCSTAMTTLLFLNQLLLFHHVPLNRCGATRPYLIDDIFLSPHHDL